MVTAGVWLIYAGVVLRILVRYAGLPRRELVALLLALYGVLLFAEPFFRRWLFRPEGRPARVQLPLAGLFLLLQAGLVVWLFCLPPYLDFPAGLFIPLSLEAVTYLGRRAGFLCIALFPVAMFSALTADARGWPFALAMSLFAGGLCFLFGSYAHQVHRAERVRSHNQRLLAELLSANRQLQGYAAQVDDLAAEQERGRLARELHDSVTQTVFGMNLTVQSARLLLDVDPARAAGQLDRLQELAASAMGEIQALVTQLRPGAMADGGLSGALRLLAAERQARDGLRVTLEVKGERALPEAVAAGLYRIAQEALTNVTRHSGAREVVVHLDLSGAQGHLQIEDRGRGFDPEAALGRQGHLGLAGMAERAREIGWRLSVDSRPGFGTRIAAEEGPPEGAG